MQNIMHVFRFARVYVINPLTNQQNDEESARKGRYGSPKCFTMDSTSHNGFWECIMLLNIFKITKPYVAFTKVILNFAVLKTTKYGKLVNTTKKAE